LGVLIFWIYQPNFIYPKAKNRLNTRQNDGLVLNQYMPLNTKDNASEPCHRDDKAAGEFGELEVIRLDV